MSAEKLGIVLENEVPIDFNFVHSLYSKVKSYCNLEKVSQSTLPSSDSKLKQQPLIDYKTFLEIEEEDFEVFHVSLSCFPLSITFILLVIVCQY